MGKTRPDRNIKPSHHNADDRATDLDGVEEAERNETFENEEADGERGSANI